MDRDEAARRLREMPQRDEVTTDPERITELRAIIEALKGQPPAPDGRHACYYPQTPCDICDPGSTGS